MRRWLVIARRSSWQPDYAEALNNLGAALCRRGALDEGEACIRRALALKPDIAGAHDNLGTVLWERGKLEEAEASIRRALALAPGFTRALDNLGSLLKDQGRLDEAIAVYRQLLQIRPEDIDGLNGLARVLAARRRCRESARDNPSSPCGSRRPRAPSGSSWTSSSSSVGRTTIAEARHAMARALTEPWARPDELAHTSASLIKQGAHIGACVARAAQAWPRSLSALELFGPGGPQMLADDELLLALLVSAQNTDIELERFLTMARRVLLEAAAGDGADGAGLEFYAALARQCFINEYVFFHGEEEIRRAGELRDALAAALETGTPISSSAAAGGGGLFSASFPFRRRPAAGQDMARAGHRRSGATGARAAGGGAIARHHSKTDSYRGCDLAPGPEPI